MTNSEYHVGELERRQEKQTARQNNFTKGDKLLTLSTKIGEHDLMTGVRKMVKLLEKQYEVRIVVTGEGENATVKSVSDGRWPKFTVKSNFLQYCQKLYCFAILLNHKVHLKSS